jgi:hypothetical protein
MHAFNIPVSEAKDGVGNRPIPDDLMRLKAEYFERTDGRSDGNGRGR